MTRKEKAQVIQTLTEEFKSSQAIVVADYKGLTVNALESLRNTARPQGIKVKVVKNTLASIALKNADVDGLELKDTNVVLWGNDQLDLAKTVAKFATENDKFAIKAGFMEGSVVSAAHIDALSKLPSRDELIGMLLSVWAGPARMFATGLDALRQKNEEAA